MFFFLRKSNCTSLSPARSQPSFHGSRAASPSPPVAPLSAGGCLPTSPARMGAANGTQPIAQSLRGDFIEWADSGGHEVQKGKHRCSLHRTHCPLAGSSQISAPVPVAVLLPVHYPPPARSPSDQKLEELQRKSSWKKLEQLKKKIQEQKRNQQAASQEQKCLIASHARELLQDRPLKRKVCRVPAPSAPCPRGQWKHSPCSKALQEKLSEHGGDGLAMGLRGLRGLFQPLMILSPWKAVLPS